MKTLSQQMTDLSDRAKAAASSASAARTQAREVVQARADKLEADVAARRAGMEASAAATKDAVTERWTDLQTQVKTGIDGIKADIDARKREGDVKRAERKAERAEANATEAIYFALDAIDYAESAVLDGIIARADADALRVAETVQ